MFRDFCQCRICYGKVIGYRIPAIGLYRLVDSESNATTELYSVRVFFEVFTVVAKNHRCNKRFGVSILYINTL